MISRQLHFQPVYAPAIGHRPDGHPVNQSVDGLGKSIDFFACPVDLPLRTEIELEESSENAARGGLEDRFRSLQLGQIAAGENEGGGAVTR